MFVIRAPFKDAKPQVFGEYRPDDVETLADLYDRGRTLCIDVDALRQAIEAYLCASLDATPPTSWPENPTFYAGIVLAAHRPAPIVGSNRRDVELLPYLLTFPLQPGVRFAPARAAVLPAAHLAPCSPMLLARASGMESADIAQPISLLGCGSVGSKIGLHLGRAGFGKFTFVDKDELRPHNMARHALLRKDDGPFNVRKVDQMRSAFEALSHRETRPAHLDVSSLLVASRDRFRSVIPDDTRLIIDATASLEVLAAAAMSQNLSETRARFCRTLMYGRGRVMVVLLEGEGRSSRVDDLTAGLFAHCRDNEELRRAILDGGGNLATVFIGENCRSQTMPMSDSVVSRGASLAAMQIERWLRDGLPAGGVLAVGTQASDGVGVQWNASEVAPAIALNSESASGWQVRVLDHVAKKISEDVAVHAGIETGGALLGSVATSTRTIIVADLVAAPPDSVRTEARFTLGTSGLVEALAEACKQTLGGLHFVGTWHSHPMGGPHSPIDLATLASIAVSGRGLPAVSLVWTPDGYRCAMARW